MKNFKIIKFGDRQPVGAFGINKLQEAFDKVMGYAGRFSFDLGDGYKIEIGPKDEKIGQEMAVIAIGHDPKMALYVDSSSMACGACPGYAAIANNGTLLLIDLERQEAASVYVGCRIYEIQSIEKLGNSIKVSFIGSFVSSDYEEQIIVSYKADSLNCLGFEINDLEKEDSSIGYDDSSDDDD